mmetsp:Transcript_5026/g.12541  ORF Transcript_5026/g.12541 Transcript_5026/m.12541 type:complete len:245 (-) Transcript_5026:820-1554(-)
MRGLVAPTWSFRGETKARAGAAASPVCAVAGSETEGGAAVPWLCSAFAGGAVTRGAGNGGSSFACAAIRGLTEIGAGAAAESLGAVAGAQTPRNGGGGSARGEKARGVRKLSRTASEFRWSRRVARLATKFAAATECAAAASDWVAAPPAAASRGVGAGDALSRRALWMQLGPMRRTRRFELTSEFPMRYLLSSLVSVFSGSSAAANSALVWCCTPTSVELLGAPLGPAGSRCSGGRTRPCAIR